MDSLDILLQQATRCGEQHDALHQERDIAPTATPGLKPIYFGQ